MTAVVAGKYDDSELSLLQMKESQGWELTGPFMMMLAESRDLIAVTQDVDPASASLVVTQGFPLIYHPRAPHPAHPHMYTLRASPRPC